MGCPGSVAYCRGHESPETVFSEEGTFAHEIAAEALLTRKNAVDYVGRTKEVFLPGADKPHVFTWSADDVEPMQKYLDFVRGLQVTLDADLLVEQKVRVLGVEDRVYGTSDVILIDDVPGQPLRIVVVDLKWGKGHAVRAEGNSQGRIYGLGALTKLGVLDPPSSREIELEVHIVQPRIGNFSSEALTKQEAYDYLKVLRSAVKATDDPRAPLVPGDHCTFCPRRGDCSALYEQGLAAAKDFFPTGDVAVRTEPPTVARMTDDQLLRVLNHQDTIESWLKQVAAEARDRALRGVQLPGWKVVERVGNRKWKDESTTAAKLVQLGCADPYVPREVVSPAEAARRITGPKKAVEAMLAPLVVRELLGYALAPETDRRPAAQIVAPTFDALDEA
jgi:hypothetical protein